MTQLSHRCAPFVETLESRQFLSGSGCDVTAPLTAAPAKAVVMKSAAAASAGQTIWGEAKAGVVLKFKKTKALPGNGIYGFIHESGTFTDEKKGAGTYELALPPVLSSTQPPQLLVLTFKTAGIARSVTVQFTPASKRWKSGLNGKTVTFAKAATGSSAKGVVMGTLGLRTVYLKYS